MTKLGRLHITQQFTAAEHNEVSIVKRERAPGGQQGVNGFAGVDKFRGLFTDIKHDGFPLRTGRQGVREGVRSLTGPPQEKILGMLSKEFIHEADQPKNRFIHIRTAAKMRPICASVMKKLPIMAAL
jgi:hypothetical protein